MTKQRNRPSLGQAALLTGLLGVGGWLASSALSSGDANASELPPDPGNYSGSIQPDAGSVDLNQLSNSVLDQIAQLRANGHDVSVGVAPEVSDQIPAALRGSSNSDSTSRKAWKKAARQVAATPSAPVLPRWTTPAVTPTAAGSDAGSASAPVTPTSQRRGHADEVPAGAVDHHDDRNGPAASTPPSAPVPADGASGAGGVAPDVGFGPENEIPSGSSDSGGDDGPSGTGQDTNTDIGDEATARDRLGANNKESRAPDEITDTGVDGTLIPKAPDIENVVNFTQRVVEAVQAGTIQPANGPEVFPSDGLDPDLTSLPYVTAITAHYVNKWGYAPIKARVVAAQQLRKAVADVNSVTGKPPSTTDPDSSADFTVREAAAGEVPVGELPPPPLMRPFGWQASQGTPDPDVEGRKPPSSEDQLMRELAERSINGQTNYVRSVGSIGGNTGESAAEHDTEPRTPLTKEEVDKWWNEREAQRAADDAPRPKIGDFENKKDAEPTEETSQSPTETPSEAAAAPSQAQEQADAEASAAAAASEQAALAEEAATIKANGAQSQAAEEANVAASQAQNAAAEQSERAEQAKETATEAQAEAASQQAETEAANGAAAEQEAAASAQFLQNEQNAEAAELSRPAGGSDADADVAGEDAGDDAVSEDAPEDADTAEGADEGVGVDEGVGPPEGELVTPAQNYMSGIPSGEADNTGEAEETGELGKPIGPNGG